MTSIKGLIDHVISEGNRIFADTRFATTWWIYHDALPQWWEAAAQAYIASRGFANRQWRARGDTNDKVSAWYRNKLMGDSPELMPLDSSLFSDLIEKVAWLVISTGKLEKGEKYSMATPDEAWRTMVAAWELVETGRIVADVSRFTAALDAIIAAKGAYVSDYDLRNGHRVVMRRLVRGGALQRVSGDVAATEALVAKGLREVLESWEGISARISG